MIQLPSPAQYFPLERPLYEVAPGLRPFGQDLGNGPLEEKLFQVDSHYHSTIQNKADCRAERISKYCVTDPGFTPELEQFVVRWMARRLVKESPEFFSLIEDASGGNKLGLENHLTGARIQLSPHEDGHISSWDAISSQVQEDLAIQIRGPGPDQDRLVALHLCSPSHWAAEDKIGLNFRSIHAPIPGVEKMNRAAPQLVQAMIDKGPYIRFVWGFATDHRLNHHPIAPPGVDPAEWHGRAYAADRPENPFSLRVERQVIWGLPEVNASLFVIRVSFIEGSVIREKPEWRDLLIGALKSMSPESRVYKGLQGSMPQVLEWLGGRS